MSRASLILLAMLGSAATLGGAFAFQYFGGLLPCHLCLIERWPHAAAVIIGLLALILGGRLLPWLGALAAASDVGLGIYHTGVERAWWPGPSSCTGSIPDATVSASDALAKILAAPVVRCDQPAWIFLHISMASWNAVVSALLLFIWIAAATRDR